MGSGPRAGIAEIRLPDLQPGSSIMPGKVNPVIPEAVYQVAAQVVGNDAAIGFGATAGAFELNTAMPMMARNLLESVHLLSTVSRLLADRCVAGIEADVERCRTNAESSSALATALTPHIGYEEAAAVVHQAAAEGKTLRQVVLDRGLLRPGEVDRILDVEAMTQRRRPVTGVSTALRSCAPQGRRRRVGADSRAREVAPSCRSMRQCWRRSSGVAGWAPATVMSALESVNRSTYIMGDLREAPTSLLVLAALSLTSGPGRAGLDPRERGALERARGRPAPGCAGGSTTSAGTAPWSGPATPAGPSPRPR